MVVFPSPTRISCTFFPPSSTNRFDGMPVSVGGPCVRKNARVYFQVAGLVILKPLLPIQIVVEVARWASHFVSPKSAGAQHSWETRNDKYGSAGRLLAPERFKTLNRPSGHGFAVCLLESRRKSATAAGDGGDEPRVQMRTATISKRCSPYSARRFRFAIHASYRWGLVTASPVLGHHGDLSSLALTSPCPCTQRIPTGCSGHWNCIKVSVCSSSWNATVAVRRVPNPPTLVTVPRPYCGCRTVIPTAKP